jgi:hypothetical protein
MATVNTNLVAKNGKEIATKYYCEKCNYICSKKYNWDKHILTSKHNVTTTSNNLSTNKWHKVAYCCENCSKEYSDRTGLWRHKKKCNVQYTNKDDSSNTDKDKDDPSDKQLFMMLLKQQTELIKENTELRKEQSDIKELILEIVKNGTHNTTNNTTHTNSHNKAFNLNFFLNETCKNAMNITDFVDSIKLQLSDLIDVGTLGYVEGISKIIVKNLNNLDETERPIHCTDKKRETMYVKDQGQWEKEDEKNTKLTKAVKRVANKNIDLLPRFREKYPEYNNSSSRISDNYDKMVIEVMETDPEKYEKIIKNISKVTTIKEK